MNETLNAVAGLLGISMGVGSIVLAIMIARLSKDWSKQTNELIRTEDARAKQLIEEMGRRTQQMIDESRKETQQMIENGNRRNEQAEERLRKSLEEGNKRLEIILEHLGGLIQGGAYIRDKEQGKQK